MQLAGINLVVAAGGERYNMQAEAGILEEYTMTLNVLDI